MRVQNIAVFRLFLFIVRPLWRRKIKSFNFKPQAFIENFVLYNFALIQFHHKTDILRVYWENVFKKWPIFALFGFEHLFWKTHKEFRDAKHGTSITMIFLSDSNKNLGSCSHIHGSQLSMLIRLDYRSYIDLSVLKYYLKVNLYKLSQKNFIEISYFILKNIVLLQKNWKMYGALNEK